MADAASDNSASTLRQPWLALPIALTLDPARGDTLSTAARSGTTLPLALEPHGAAIVRVAAQVPQP